MNLQLSEEQALLEASVRSFLAAEYGWDKRQRSLQAPHACAPSQWRQFATLGWLGLRVPEALGGSGPLAQRLQAYRAGEEIPPDRLEECIHAFSSALRCLPT